jgi:tetratricopeptide (TPR) repeat protein
MVSLIRAEAQKAVDLYEDSDHGLLGVVAAAYDYDWKEAEKHFQIAVADTQGLPEMKMAYAIFTLIPSGRLQEAMNLMEQVVATDPLHVPLRSSLAACLLSAEMYDRAIEEARKALEIDERLWIPCSSLVLGYVAKGMTAEALAAAEKAYQIAPWHPRVIGSLAGVLARTGERGRAEFLLGQLSNAQGGLVTAEGMVLYHLLRSEVDAAADWYEKGIEQRIPILVPWIRLPLTRPLRESPRWPKIAKMMKLPETISQLS